MLSLRASGAPGPTPGPALAAVSMLGYAGFLAGPPVIGLVTDPTGELRLALTLVWALCVAAASLATRMDERRAVP